MKIFSVTTLLAGVSLWGQAQICGSNVPSFSINLSGSPDSVWTSPKVSRLDTCCGASGTDECIKFVVTLDPGAYGIELDISRGTPPSGSAFYYNRCSSATSLGDDMCLTGPGPHEITFCNPGQGANVYQITSLAKPDLSNSIAISGTCTGLLTVNGYVSSSITWSSTPFDSVNNSFLSCTKGCDTTYINGKYPLPDSVYYKVCGTIIGCPSHSLGYCDSVRVDFLADLKAEISPDSPKVCFGLINTPLTATPSGGTGTYHYEWRLIDSTWIDTGRVLKGKPGKTYVLKVHDSTSCQPGFDTVYVDSFSTPIVANAGLDQSMCKSDSVIQLGGSIQNALGGRWSLGKGAFMPHDSALKAIYQPSVTELSIGSVTLRLSTYGNHDCTGNWDEVSIALNGGGAPKISGDDSVCLYRTLTYSVSAIDKSNSATSTDTPSYTWLIRGGIITGYSTDSSSVTVKWTDSLNNKLWLTETSPDGCTGTDSLSIHVFGRSATSIKGSDSLCSNIATATFKAIPHHPNQTYKWAITNASIQSSAQDSMVANLASSGVGNSTVTLYLTDSAGCFDTLTTNLRIDPLPVSVITGRDTVCELTTAHYLASVGVAHAWSVTNGTVISGSGTDSLVVQWHRKDTFHNISVIITNNLGCSSPVTKKVIVNSRPDSIINGPDTVCELSSVNYSSLDGISYLWSAVNGAITSGAGTDSIKVHWPRKNTVHSLSVNVANQFGCTSSTTKLIVVNGRPDSVITGPDTYCELSSANYSASHGASHLWSITNGSILSGSGTDSIRVNWPHKSNSHELSVTITDQYGCKSTASKFVTINPKPDSSILGPDTLCELSLANYTVSAGHSYYWSVTNGSIIKGAGSDSIAVSWPKKGTSHVLDVLITNQLGCDGFASKNITLLASPDSLILGPDTVCEFSSTKYFTNAGSRHFWGITGGTFIGSDSVKAVSVDWPEAGNKHYLHVFITDTNGCTSKGRKDILLKVLPKAIIQGTKTACLNGNEELKFESASKASDYTYTWLTNNLQIVSGAGTALLKTKSPDQLVASIKLSITDGLGCTSDTSHRIWGLTFNRQKIIGKENVCNNEAYSYYLPYPPITGTSRHNIEWQVMGGGIIENINDSLVTVLWDSIGTTGSIVVTLNNKYGCDTTLNKAIIKLQAPNTEILGPDTVCAFDTRTFGAQGQPSVSYHWDVTGGEMIGNRQTAIDITWLDENKGRIKLSVANNKTGCSAQFEKKITIREAPTPAISGEERICPNDNRQIYFTPKKANTLYTWTVTHGEIDSILKPHKVEIIWHEREGFVQVYAVNELTGCDTTLNKTVKLISKISATPHDPEMCDLNDFTFSASSNDPEAKFEWDMGDGTGLIEGSSISYRYRKRGQYSVKVIGHSFNMCWDTLFTTATIHKKPKAYFEYYGNNDPIWEKKDTVFFVDKSVDAVSWEWRFHDSINAHSKDAWRVYDRLGNHSVWLTVTSIEGCTDSIRSFVEVQAPVNIIPPTAFSPNGDGTNDYFCMPGHHVAELSIRIYNRWGQQVYESNDPDFKWDGTFNGEVVQDDTYFWTVLARDVFQNPIYLQGAVMVIK